MEVIELIKKPLRSGEINIANKMLNDIIQSKEFASNIVPYIEKNQILILSMLSKIKINLVDKKDISDVEANEFEGFFTTEFFLDFMTWNLLSVYILHFIFDEIVAVILWDEEEPSCSNIPRKIIMKEYAAYFEDFYAGALYRYSAPKMAPIFNTFMERYYEYYAIELTNMQKSLLDASCGDKCEVSNTQFNILYKDMNCLNDSLTSKKSFQEILQNFLHVIDGDVNLRRSMFALELDQG